MEGDCGQLEFGQLYGIINQLKGDIRDGQQSKEDCQPGASFFFEPKKIVN